MNAVSNKDPSSNKHDIKHRRKSLGHNITQLRRSPRKKVSTASIVSHNTYRSGIQKPTINIGPSGDAGSIYSGDTNSIISNRRSLPGSTHQFSKKEKELEHKTAFIEREDSRATRSGRTSSSILNSHDSSKTVHNNTALSTGNPDENFKQKLRNAVYDALKEKDICENDKVSKIIINLYQYFSYYPNITSN